MNTTERKSNIELFRIVTMLFIVAHHYVVNSGLNSLIEKNSTVSMNSIFLAIFGAEGKTGINCFVLITGYFMCTSNITKKKFLKLLLEVEVYNLIINLIFLLFGNYPMTAKDFWCALLPVKIGTGFTWSYLFFYLFIPYINKLIQAMKEKEHLGLIGLGIFLFTILPSVLSNLIKFQVSFDYISWFMIVYFIGAYIRLYPKTWFDNKARWGIATGSSLFISWSSVLVLYFMTKAGICKETYYFFVANSNKILALITAVCAFMWFKNIEIKRSKIINTMAGSTFAVLIIHDNSSVMRKWLWKDILHTTAFFHSKYVFLHAIISVIGVYLICTFIDIIRKKMIAGPISLCLVRVRKII